MAPRLTHARSSSGLSSTTRTNSPTRGLTLYSLQSQSRKASNGTCTGDVITLRESGAQLRAPEIETQLNVLYWDILVPRCDRLGETDSDFGERGERGLSDC